MNIVCKQTMWQCFNSFNANLLVPRPPNLHKKISKQQKITLYTMANSHKLSIYERQIYVYSSRKSSLKEGALPTLYLSDSSANTNATTNRSKRAIEKREEYALLEE